jgi:hypothetical protein
MSTGPEGAHRPDVRALEMILDYAILEGAELQLPTFVLLLRTAQRELINCLDPGNRAACAVAAPRNDSAPLARSDERPDDCTLLIQDR